MLILVQKCTHVCTCVFCTNYVDFYLLFSVLLDSFIKEIGVSGNINDTD